MTRYRCPECLDVFRTPRGYAAHLDRTACIPERPVIEP
jgi:uncharacterized C2H2 Zn-finger protein